MTTSPELPAAVRRLIADAGSTTQSFGLGRVVGQIYAYLYFSRSPRCLGDMQRDLGISKGSASMGIRQLEQWEAARKTTREGDRKDYFAACDGFGKILKRAIVDTVTSKMETYQQMLAEVDQMLANQHDAEPEQAAFLQERLETLRLFHARVGNLWNNPIVRTLLK